MSLDFETFTLERRIACPPHRLFALMTDPAARAAWGAPDETSVIEIDHCDVRPGGHEIARCGPKEAPDFDTRTDFHVVVPDEALVATETLSVGGEMLSVALISQEIAADGAGSHLTVTLQIAALAGPEMAAGYRDGWSAALDNLDRLAALSPEAAQGRKTLANILGEDIP